MRIGFSLRALVFSWAAVVGSVCFAQTVSGPGSVQPLAVVNGKNIYEEDLSGVIGAQLMQLRNQEFELKSKALERVIRQRLLDAEAARRGLSADKLLEQQVDASISEPAEGELEAYYLAQKDRLGGRTFQEIRPQIREQLKQARLQKARSDFADSLRQKADVAILLRPPRVEVAVDPARVKGDPGAAVTIVEFSDFECPFCRRVQPVLGELAAKYQGRVRMAYRDFPLREIHPNAQKAAEAARCAGEQGRFWEYKDAVFAETSKLDAAGLLDRARRLKLDEGNFKSCLESGKFSAAVEQDVQEGSRAGVSGTPAFFINGVFLSGAQPKAEFERIIDAELAAAKPRPGH